MLENLEIIENNIDSLGSLDFLDYIGAPIASEWRKL